jgi:hypothetical protein
MKSRVETQAILTNYTLTNLSASLKHPGDDVFERFAMASSSSGPSLARLLGLTDGHASHDLDPQEGAPDPDGP